MNYANNGNINSKTSIGDYSYGAKPHAVTGVTNPSNLISSAEQKISYTAFNKADTIIQNTYKYILKYGAQEQRTISKLFRNDTLQKTVYYNGLYEKEIVTGITYPKEIHYIYGGDGLAAIFTKQSSDSYMYYVHKDHLGSFDKLTNSAGAVVQKTSFDAWGRRRNPDNWTYGNIPTTLFSRGYTGHEHLDQFELINMNGRMYDPLVGRFLNPDPLTTDPYFTQGLNKYSYVLNNPLKYTDPSGYYKRLDDPRPEGGICSGLESGVPTPGASISNLINGGITYSDYIWNKILEGVVELGSVSSDGSFSATVKLNSFDGYVTIASKIEWTEFSSIEANCPYPNTLPGVDISSHPESKTIRIGPQGGGGPGWEAYAGAAASVGSELYYSKTYGTWMGKNFKIYQQTWGGNGIAGGKNKFGKTTSNGFKWAGRLVGAYSGYRTIEQRVNGEIGTGWMLAELGTTGVSTFGGLYGAAWGIGWEAGRFITSMEWYQEAKFNFWNNHWESQVGPPSQSNEALWYYFYQNYKP